MANVQGAYCALEDLRTGDLATPSYTSRDQYIKNAAEEIDTALGHLYVTPFVIDSDDEFRPSILYLKKCNWLLASGRMIADIAAAGESDNLHAYAKRMLDEAMEMLEYIANGKFVLAGAEQIVSVDAENWTGPSIHNEDSVSMVQQFYDIRRPSPFYVPRIPPMYPPIQPYDNESDVSSA